MGPAIPAVADVLDALSSARPYKKAWSLEDSIAYVLAHDGTHFDPQVVNAMSAAAEAICQIHRAYSEERKLTS